MNDTSMMARFAASEFDPIQVDGRLVHGVVSIPVQLGDSIHVHWRSAIKERAQGLAFWLRKPAVKGAKGRGGLLSDGGVEAPSFRFWADDPAGDKTLKVTKLASDAVLRVSNVWVAPGGRIDEWLNEYGILVTVSTDGCVYELECSDGYAAFTPGDLRATVSVHRAV